MIGGFVLCSSAPDLRLGIAPLVGDAARMARCSNLSGGEHFREIGAREIERRSVVVGLGFHVGAFLSEEASDLKVIVHGGDVKWRSLAVVLGVNVGTLCDQQAGDEIVTVHCCEVQRRSQMGVFGVDIGTFLNEQSGHLNLTVYGGCE